MISEKKIIHILEPITDSIVGPNPHIRWYISNNAISNAKFKLQIFSVKKGLLTSINKRAINRKLVKEYEMSKGEDVIIQEPLQDGNWDIRIVATLPFKSKKVSGYTRVTVSPKKAFPNRIYCESAWFNLFLGPIRANPCCNLKPHAGFPYNPKVSTIDPLNSPGMIALRESLLAGNPVFCHPGCSSLKRSNLFNSPEEAYSSFLSKKTIPEVVDSAQPMQDTPLKKAFIRGEVVLQYPYKLKVALGSNCNHACIFCKSIKRNWKQENSVFSGIISRYAADISELELTGGEPLIYWKNFISKIQSSAIDLTGITLSFITNGALLLNFASDLEKFVSLELVISLNAATPETYKFVHRVDDMQKVIDGISLVQKLRINKPTKITIKMVYMRSTYKEIPLFVELAKRLKIDRAVFTNMTYFRQADVPPSEALLIDDPEWPKVDNFLKEAHLELKKCGIACSSRRPGEKRVAKLDNVKANSSG